MNDTTKTITKASDMEGRFETIVKAEGFYRLMNVSKRPGTIVFSNRVYLELADKQFIILETHDRGLRSKEEIEKFINKKISISGTLKSQRVIWGDGLQAAIVGICIVDIIHIEETK